MSQVSVSGILVDAFSSELLIDIDQDDGLPTIDDDGFLTLLETPVYDCRASFTFQQSRLLEEVKEHHSLSTHAVNSCYFVDLLFEALEGQSGIDQQLLNAIFPLKKLFVKMLLKDPKFVQSSKHYLRQLLDRLFYASVGWYGGAGETAEKFLFDCGVLVTEIMKLSGDELELPENVESRFGYIELAVEESSFQEEKICRIERRKMKERQPIRDVDEFLDKHLAGKLFPETVVSFLSDTWRKNLVAYRKDNHFSPAAWNKLTEFSVDMIDHFSTNKESNSLAVIPIIHPGLEKYLKGNESDKARVIHAIDKVNQDILNGVSVEGVAIKPFLEENRLVNMKVGRSVSSLVENLKSGQWVLFKGENGQEKRYRIVSKFDEVKEFLLVDFSGAKTITRSYHGLAYDIATKSAKVLDSVKLFNKCFVNALELYFLQYKSRKKFLSEEKLRLEKENKKLLALEKAKMEAEVLRMQKYEMEEKLKKETERLKKKNEEIEGRIKKELEDKFAQETDRIRIEKEQKNAQLQEKYVDKVELLKMEKLQLEKARNIELESLKKEKELLEQELKRKLGENRQYEAEQSVKSLAIGSWVAMPDNKGGEVPCKLAIIYGSTGKYVFVDGNGIRIGEYKSEELVELFLEEKARIIKEESSFDSSMEKIIQSLRQ